MTKIFCDFCGKDITKYDSDRESVFFMNDGDHDADLCPECAIRIKTYIMGMRLEEKEKNK